MASRWTDGPEGPEARREALRARRAARRRQIRRRRLTAIGLLVAAAVAVVAVVAMASGGSGGGSDVRGVTEVAIGAGQLSQKEVAGVKESSNGGEGGKVRNATPQPGWEPHTGPAAEAGRDLLRRRNFCYPSGRFDDTVIAAVEKAGYVGATTEIPGYAERDKPYELARFEILGSTGVSGLEADLASG
jgi:hypothetical protein